MALIVNEALSSIGDVSGKVVIDSDQPPSQAYPELSSADCRRKALMFAAQRGLASPGINGNVEIYPLDEQGEEIQCETAEQLKSAKIRSFRATVPVTRRIG